MRLLTLSLVMIFCISFAFAETPWFELYDSALSDIRSKNWNLAEEKLKAALAQQPNQGKKVRAYGARFMKYIPEYHLAVIHYHTGKYQQALEEFLRVRNKGLVTEGDEEYTELSKLQEQSIAKLNPQVPQAPTGPNLEVRFADLMKDAESALQQNNFEKAKQLTKEAMGTGVDQTKASALMMKIHVGEAANALKLSLNKNDLAQAKQDAEKLKMLDANHPELTRAQQMFAQKVEPEKPPAPVKVEPAVPAPAPPTTADLKPPGSTPVTPDQLTALQKQQIAGNTERLQKLMRGKDWIQARQVAQETLQLDPTNRKVAGFASQVEEEVAVLSFYQGEYQNAADTLKYLTSRDRKSARNYFYLGCSIAALAFLEDQDRPRLLQMAQQQFLQAKRLDPRLQFDRRFISPRILNVYDLGAAR